MKYLYREPKVMELGLVGDRRRFVCVIEGEPGQIAGGAFSITPREEGDVIAWTRGLEAAWKRARERAELGQWLPSGSEWEDFL